MKTLRIVLIMTVFLLGGLQTEAHSRGYVVSFGYFYNELSPYGEWIEFNDGLVVWRPSGVHNLWAPYSYGTWIWTNHGWYWNSYEAFGLIVYHYGRWYYDDYYGWIWVPDYQWGPSWVEWRYDDDYIGWAPLPPYAGFSIRYGISYSVHFSFGYHHWHFVKYRNFCSSNVSYYFVHDRYKYRIYQRTRTYNNYYYENDRVVNRGLDREFLRNRGAGNIREREIVFRETDDRRMNVSTSGNDRIEITVPKGDANNEGIRDLRDLKKTSRNSGLEREKINISDRNMQNDIAMERNRNEFDKKNRNNNDIESKDKDRGKKERGINEDYGSKRDIRNSSDDNYRKKDERQIKEENNSLKRNDEWNDTNDKRNTRIQQEKNETRNYQGYRKNDEESTPRRVPVPEVRVENNREVISRDKHDEVRSERNRTEIKRDRNTIDNNSRERRRKD